MDDPQLRLFLVKSPPSLPHPYFYQFPVLHNHYPILPFPSPPLPLRQSHRCSYGACSALRIVRGLLWHNAIVTVISCICWWLITLRLIYSKTEIKTELIMMNKEMFFNEERSSMFSLRPINTNNYYKYQSEKVTKVEIKFLLYFLY